MKGEMEGLRSYIDWFAQVLVEVERTEESLKCWIFKKGLLHGHPFHTKLGKKKVKATKEMLNLAQPNITLKEKLNTHFDNLTSPANENFECPPGKESQRQREDVDKGVYGRYDKYTPLKISQGEIYGEYDNTKFKKAGIRPPNLVQTNKSKYYQFHMG